MNLCRNKYVLPSLDLEIMREAKTYFEEYGTYDVLLSLYSLYGSLVQRATEVLATSTVVEYRSIDHIRKIYIIGSPKGQYALFDQINFCPCYSFKCQVLGTQSLMTCKHVLALKLAQITDEVRRETVTESRLIELLNDQISNISDANLQDI